MDAAENLSNQFLTFSLAEDIFAVDVLVAREILDFSKITRVPQTPDYMLGVINLRGSAVPVIDMRLKFGMNKIDKTRDSCVIVMEVYVDGNSVVVGTLADSVREVLDLNPSVSNGWRREEAFTQWCFDIIFISSGKQLG